MIIAKCSLGMLDMGFVAGFRYLDLVSTKQPFPFLIDCEDTVVSFPPITNCESTKVSELKLAHKLRYPYQEHIPQDTHISTLLPKTPFNRSTWLLMCELFSVDYLCNHRHSAWGDQQCLPCCMQVCYGAAYSGMPIIGDYCWQAAGSSAGEGQWH